MGSPGRSLATRFSTRTHEVCHATRIDVFPPPPGTAGALPPNPGRAHLSGGAAPYDGRQHGRHLPHAGCDPGGLTWRWGGKLLSTRTTGKGRKPRCGARSGHTPMLPPQLISYTCRALRTGLSSTDFRPAI